MSLSTALQDIFRFTIPPLELVLRGSMMFWFLFLIFRFVLRRDIGTVGITDFLFVVLLGDAAQNAMIGQGTSTADGIVLISTLVMWNWAIDYLSFRFPAIERVMTGTRLCLVRDGKMQRRNMRTENISTEELARKVREAGLEDLQDVKAMYLEADGEISIIKRR